MKISRNLNIVWEAPDLSTKRLYKRIWGFSKPDILKQLIIISLIIKYKCKWCICAISDPYKLRIVSGQRKRPSSKSGNLRISISHIDIQKIKYVPKRIVRCRDFDSIYLISNFYLKLIIPRGYIWKVVIKAKRYQINGIYI
jgi:hypothetical protein